jgi:spermidine synthase
MPGAEVRADLWINEYVSPWDIYSHGVTRVFIHKTTPFQEMYIVETGLYGKGLVLDGKWQSCTGDEFLYHEPLVHPAMIAHGNAKRVLVLGGGEGATVREVLRWKGVERVVMVDIDGDVVESCKKFLPEMHQGAFEDPRTELAIGDAVRYLHECDETFDVVISDLSDPIEEGPSFQLFTKEYIEKVRGVLTDGGTFVLQSGYISPANPTSHARLASTQRAVFPNVISYAQHVPTYCATWSYTLASERPLTGLRDVAQIDRILGEKTNGGLRMLDGVSLLGMQHLPLYIRKAIEQETRIYTLNEPMKFFGKGVATG